MGDTPTRPQSRVRHSAVGVWLRACCRWRLANTLVCLLVLLAWLFLLANLLLACLWRLTSERNELTNGVFYGAVSYNSMFRSWYSPVVLVCCVLPWSFPARVSCPRLRFIDTVLYRYSTVLCTGKKTPGGAGTHTGYRYLFFRYTPLSQCAPTTRRPMWRSGCSRQHGEVERIDWTMAAHLDSQLCCRLPIASRQRRRCVALCAGCRRDTHIKHSGGGQSRRRYDLFEYDGGNLPVHAQIS